MVLVVFVVVLSLLCVCHGCTVSFSMLSRTVDVRPELQNWDFVTGVGNDDAISFVKTEVLLTLFDYYVW